MTQWSHRLALAISLGWITSCGSTTPAQDPYGTTTAANTEHTIQAFELALRDSRGEALSLADFRGRTVLLYLFATFDLPSQAALEPLQEVARAHPELNVIGIALQPEPQDLLGIFADALQLEITLAYEPDNRLLRGLTDLGSVEGVPTYVLIDRHGLITKRWTGALNAAALRQWCGYE